MLLPFSLLLLLAFAQVIPPALTPGSINPDVTQFNIHQTICLSQWVKSVQPYPPYIEDVKRKQIIELKLPGKPSDYVEDNLVPIELGGNVVDVHNLWPEPVSGKYNAKAKDKLEQAMYKDVCAGKLSLLIAQTIFMDDFWAEYKKRFEK